MLARSNCAASRMVASPINSATYIASVGHMLQNFSIFMEILVVTPFKIDVLRANAGFGLVVSPRDNELSGSYCRGSCLLACATNSENDISKKFCVLEISKNFTFL